MPYNSYLKKILDNWQITPFWGLASRTPTRIFILGFALWLAYVASASTEPRHAIAMHGDPRYGAGFQHFEYVNPAAPKGGRLRLAVLGSFDSTNQYIIKGQAVAGVRDYVHESLMARSYDEPFSLYGLLAESIDTPENRSSVTFHLRQDAKFSDGGAVTPDDVIFSWALLKEKGRPFHRSYYKKVSLAEKVGDTAVRFTFTAAGDLEMPLIMGLMPILPRKTTPPPEEFDKTSFAKPIGSGPYIIEHLSPGESITYRRNPNYWGRDLAVNRGQFNFDTIRYDYYRDSTSMMEAFRKGLFDMQGEGDPLRWQEAYDFPAAREGRVQKLEFSIATPAPMTALVFNTRRPLFGDKRVRDALSLAFDFEWMNKTLFRGLYERTQSFFERSELSAAGRAVDSKEQELLHPFRMEITRDVMNGMARQHETDGSGTNREGRRRALMLLNEAGYELQDGTMQRKADGTKLTFEMLCTNREQERLMLAYSRSLQQIGIAVTIRLVDAAQYQRRLTSFDFDMVQASWASSLSPGNEQSFRWSKAAAQQDGSFNYAGVKSEAADAMIQALLSAKTRPDFVSAVRALDRVLLSGSYVIPLYYIKKQWIAAWAYLRHPPISTLYGTRVETWWSDAATSAANR